MSDDDPILTLAVLGSAALVGTALLAPRRAHARSLAVPIVPPATTAPLPPTAAPRPTTWVWPVPTLGAADAVISDGWGSGRTDPDGTKRRHLGADLMYRRRHLGPGGAQYPVGSHNGSRAYVMPDGVYALAVADGQVWSAGWTRRGFSVVLHHAAGWATYYTHLASLSVRETKRGQSGERVATGQPLGEIGFDPSGSRRLKHLHFELWRDRSRVRAVDPAPYLAGWRHARDERSPAPLRNGGLVYRPLGDPGDPYPDWVRRLRGKSGVYVIRERAHDGDAPEVVYVGESHAHRLYETLTRHFQTWRRRKGWWKGQFAEGHDPGLNYDRARVDVAVRETTAAGALDAEAALIRRLRPRDNLLGQVVTDDVPF